MKILLIRHGQTEADLQHIHEGRYNSPLTSLGVEQVTNMAKEVSQMFSIDHLYSSTLLRAKQTTHILEKEVYLHIEQHHITYKDGLQEWDNGVLAGMSREEALEKYPLPKEGRPIHEPILNGESQIEFRTRVEIAFREILHHAQHHQFQTIAIVSHGGTISKMIESFLELPFQETLHIASGDAAFHLLEWRGEDKIIRFLNKQAN